MIDSGGSSFLLPTTRSLPKQVMVTVRAYSILVALSHRRVINTVLKDSQWSGGGFYTGNPSSSVEVWEPRLPPPEQMAFIGPLGTGDCLGFS